MEKKEERTPEEIARDLETIDFDEIAEGDLKEVFGGGLGKLADADCNCGNYNCGCGS